LTTAGLMLISGFCAFFIGYTVEISALLFATVAIIWGATVVADSGQFSAAVTELSDQRLVGTALTFQMAIGYGVTLLTVWLVPTMAQKSDSFQWAFLILVPGPLIGAAAMLLLRQRDEATLLANGKR
ncbi:MAG: MFS transporter, partial [Paracoccaceae bacterium]